MSSTQLDTTEAHASKVRPFRADVQGLRAVAVILVLLFHAGIPVIRGGYIGVDVFFVISGFLISSHLLETMERDNRIDFAEFYARRARRILPASLTVAFLTTVAAVVFYPPLGLERVLRDSLATILYVPNLWFTIQKTDYLADHSASPFQHYWSLGVEEQFYLFWPLILVMFGLIVRRRVRLMTALIALLGASSLALGVFVTFADQPAAFFLLPTRAWELLAGALVGALLLRGRPRMPAWLVAAGGWVGLALIVACAMLYDEHTAFPGTAAIVPVLGTAMVIYFGASGVKTGPTMALSARPMQFLGLISYSLYLVHWPLLVVTQAAVGDQHPLPVVVKVLLGVVLAVPLAWLLFRFIESPLRAPAWLTRRGSRTTLFGVLAVTAVFAVGVASTSAWAATRDLATGPAVAVAPTSPTSPPRATSVLPANLLPSLRSVASDLPPMYQDGCHHDVARRDVQRCHYGNDDGESRVALFGDSHAAQWFPALSSFADLDPAITIETYTKSSCPAVDITVLDKDVPYSACDLWRDAVLADLVTRPPAMVVISSYSAYALSGAQQQDRTVAWAKGVTSTVERLEAAGSNVLVIADTPRFSSPPPVCISAHTFDVDACDGERDEVLDAKLVVAEKKATEGAGGTYLDLNGFVCNTKTCPVIIDNLLVYRDVNHLTTPFVDYLAPRLAPVLDELVHGSEAGGL